MIKLSLGAGMCWEQETHGSRLIWELSAALKCQGTPNNETGFVGITYLYGHILACVCVCVCVCVCLPACIFQYGCICESLYTNLKVKMCGL